MIGMICCSNLLVCVLKYRENCIIWGVVCIARKLVRLVILVIISCFWVIFSFLVGEFCCSIFCGGISSALLPLWGCVSAPPAACPMCSIGVISLSKNWYNWFPWSFYKAYFNPVVVAFWHLKRKLF